MNFKQLGVLLSISTILAINVIGNKALGADPSITLGADPSITFGKAVAAGACIFKNQLVKSDLRTLLLTLDKFSSLNGERKTCILRVNTTIPSGFRVQNVRVMYQGSTQVGLNSKGVTLSRSYIFNGGAFGQILAPSKTSTFKTSEPLFKTQDDVDFLSGSCGGQGQFGLNLVAQSSAGSNITLDPPYLTVHFNLSPCS